MRRAAIAARLIGLSSATLALTTLCACGLNFEKILPPDEPTLSNQEAVDRALQLCSLTNGERPFHLILTINPPPSANPSPPRKQWLKPNQSQRTQVEIFWLNPVTYRTEIHSPDFSQTRIVNGSVVEEHNSGAFYPRWIQNFIDAILEPVPDAATLRKIPGSVPVSHIAHACISNSSHPEGSREVGTSPIGATARICFQDSDPKIASGFDAVRYVAFDEFVPFGNQQIARTLVNVLSANTLVRGHIMILEPLRPAAYAVVKAHEFTPAEKQIRTALVPELTARSLLDESFGPMHPSTRARTPGHSHDATSTSFGLSDVERTSLTTTRPQTSRQSNDTQSSTSSHPGTIYIRTDRTGKVREAYSDSSDFYGLQNAAITHAFTLKFKPLIIHGVPHQMEAPLSLP
jgi:hypothetical protein